MLAFTDLHAEEVLCSDFFPNISEFLLSSIMQRNLKAQEEVKLNAILAWGDAHYQPLDQKSTFISKLICGERGYCLLENHGRRGKSRINIKW